MFPAVLRFIIHGKYDTHMKYEHFHSSITCMITINWIYSTIWPPKAWSCFMLYVKTNNDLEGLHNQERNQIEKSAKHPFYKLTTVLYEIAKEEPLVATMLCNEKLAGKVKKFAI